MAATGTSNAQSRGPEIAVNGAAPRLRRELAAAARHALQARGYRRGRLEIAVVDAGEMSRQHRRWMGKRSATDVLSFDLREAPAAGVVDGQLLVCEPVARREAARRGVNWQDELTLYVLHGCLHLCGLDDHEPSEARRMHALEDRLLAELGRPPGNVETPC